MNQSEKLIEFKKLHSKENPLILINSWDKQSSAIVCDLGNGVIATSSWAMAKHFGYQDGENLPFKLLLQIIESICCDNDTIVSVDIESGYADELNSLQNNIKDLIACGIVGINIEDKIVNTDKLYTIKEQGQRLNAVRNAYLSLDTPIFINARTDTFFTGNALQNNSNTNILNETLERATIYMAQGADCLFIPGLKNQEFIKIICEKSPIPINIMLDYGTDNINDYLKLGVSRISFGPTIYLNSLASIENSIRLVNETLFNKQIV
ncbi:isocitrate lyase/PEP mutase family protein [Lacrimispora brassicae]